MTQQMTATAADYGLIFEDNPHGATIFEDLIQRSGRVPPSSGGIDRVLNQFEYAGQRKVIEFITLRINQSNGVKEDPTE